METIIDLAIAVFAGYGAGQFAAPRIAGADLGRRANGIAGGVGGVIVVMLLEWLVPFVRPTSPDPVSIIAGTTLILVGGLAGGAVASVLAGLARGKGRAE